MQCEDRRSPDLEAPQHAFDQVRRGRLRRLHYKHTTVCHRDQRQLLAHLFFAVLARSVGRHVRDLSEESAGAGLTARVGIDLRVQHDHPERLTGGKQTRQVLEPDVQHGSVAADGEYRWAHSELFVIELTPIEGTEGFLVNVSVVLVVQFQFCPADSHETISHLAHVTFEDPDGYRRCVLEQMVGPRERIWVVRIRTAPDRRTTGRVRHSQRRPALATRSLGIAPPEILEVMDDGVDAFHQFLLRLLQRDLDFTLFLAHGIQIGIGREYVTRLCVQSRDEIVELENVLLDPRYHDRVHRREHEVDRGLLTAAHA